MGAAEVVVARLTTKAPCTVEAGCQAFWGCRKGKKGGGKVSFHYLCRWCWTGPLLAGAGQYRVQQSQFC